MEVTKDSSETVFSKILQMVNQSQKSLTKTATLIQRLEPKYVTIVLALFPLVLLAGPYVFWLVVGNELIQKYGVFNFSFTMCSGS